MTGSGRLRGKVVLVTGAGSAGPEAGIGKAIAMVFAREGASVFAVDRDKPRLEQTEGDIRADGGRIDTAVGDVTVAADCERIVESEMKAFGRLDIVVNNVGTGSSTPLDDLSEEDWERVMTTNVKSVALLTKRAAPFLAARGGAVVNIASIGGIVAFGSGVYGASKAAVIMLTKDLAVAYGRRGIRVNAVAPGHVYTPYLGEIPAERREERRKVAPLGIEGTAWDVAYAALFLAGDEARFITGVCLPVDGGVSITSPLQAHRLLEE